MTAEPIVSVSRLVKRYGKVEAVRGIDFEIHRGEVFGLLGPNGAGKTTTIEIIEGLRQADAGEVRVCGLDPRRDSDHVKQRIGAQLQSTVLSDKMTAGEAVELFASFYRKRRSPTQLLRRFGLEEKYHAFYDTLSGGQKQRLALLLALVNDPELVLLDEPTAGLDPQVRREIYDVIREMKREGRTVLLTTHYIEEAELLCDRVAIMDFGKLIALDTPRALTERSGSHSRLEIRLARPADVYKLMELEAVADVHAADGGYLLYSTQPARSLVALVKFLEAADNELMDLHIARPSLEDVFIEITGRRLRD